MKVAGWMLMLGLAGVAGAQNAPAANAPAPPKSRGWLLVVDKPYVGVREFDREQKKDGGKTLKVHETQKFWRDSAGRVREEVTRDNEKRVWTYLTDPAAKTQYRWNNEAKVAFETKLGEPIPAHEAAHPLEAGEVRKIAVMVNGQKTRGTASLLPPKTIEGQETTGVREVLYSDPEQKTTLSTSDRWSLLAYHVALEEDIQDQQYGHRTFHWKSFKTEEPKADLLMVPKGFTVKQQETPDTEQFE